MYKCFCGLEFESHRQRNAHQIAHADRPKRYSVSRRKNQQVYNCLQCNKEFEHSNSTQNKFCSVSCKGQYSWEKVSIPRIKEGLGGNLKRYLKEKVGDFCSICKSPPIWQGKELVLQLDHIDGDSDNNHPSNVRLLCPNCHTQTDFFGSKGHGSRYKKITKRNTYLRDYKNSGSCVER